MKFTITKNNNDEISSQLTEYFSSAEENARETKFVQRASPMNGKIFLLTLVIGFLKNPIASLNQLAQESSRMGVQISPQGLDDRINNRSVEFLKVMYQKAFDKFKSRQALPIDILKQFTKLFLVDSTFKVLPESMAKEFPGSGGKASKSSLKVQLVYEFIYGNLAQLVVESGRSADQAYTQYLNVVEPGSLVIMDLGYFRLSSLCEIVAKSAYFIIRYHYPTSLFHPDGTRIALLDLLQNSNQNPDEIPVLLGASAKKRIACRMISTKVPLGVAEERRRKAKRKAYEHGKTLSDDYLRSLEWSVFLTNVPASMLSTDQVISFYRIRWQIELIFKLWKSYCGLDHILAVREARVLTEFYAKLLVAVLCAFFIAPVRIPDESCSDREISTFQVRIILSDFAQDLASSLCNPVALISFLELFFCQITRYGFKQSRNKKPNACALLSNMSIPGSPA